MTVRKAVFAGSWYPSTASACEKQIRDFLESTGRTTLGRRSRVGGIVPHAGWFYSGQIACNVIHCLAEDDHPDLFVIFGMHLHPASSCYMMASGAWETPFGEIEIHKELAAELGKEFDFKIETPDHFIQDNTIELQLPFIKYFFKGVKILPIGVPPAERSLEIGRRAAELSRALGLRMKVLGSTDLTHYGRNYGYAPHGSGPEALEWVRNENDHRLIQRILALDPEGVIRESRTNQNACCGGSVATAIASAKQLGAAQAETVAYATSYDKSPGESFVGYVGVVF